MKRSLLDNSIVWAIRLVTYFVIIVVGYIIFDIVIKGVPAISWKFLTTMPTDGGKSGGIFPAIVGTFYLVTGAILFALPLGIACAVYLSEYAKSGKFVDVVRLAITTLAGVPSIVFGLFGVGLFVLFLGGWIEKLSGGNIRAGESIFAGALTLGCLILPTIIVASEEALRAVPRDLRAASMALGATKWHTIRTNVLPYAFPGILTGSILGIGRAAGETAPILFTAAAFFLPALPQSIFDKVMALPYHLYVASTQFTGLEGSRDIQYGTALTLMALVLGMNLSAIILRAWFSRKYRW